MTGNIETNSCVVGGIISSANIIGTISSDTVLAGAFIPSIVVREGELPDYDGPYTVIPESIKQVLDTTNKSLRDDISINPIPYYDVSNQYGRTIYIGGTLNG